MSWWSFPAMGTSISVRALRRGSVDGVQSLFAAVEDIASRFRPDSELNRVNGQSGTRISISDALASLLHAADEMRTRTNGLVDIGVGGDVIRWGYTETLENLVSRSDFEVSTRQVTPQWSVDARTVAIGPETSLDLGGIAKGWTVDRAMAIPGVLAVSAGGDMRAIDPHESVAIVHPFGGHAARVGLRGGALATSSRHQRKWMVRGGEAHHLIDPRTAGPARSPILSASVQAVTAVEAEAGAKAVLLQGEDGLAWADAQTWIHGALATWQDGAVYATTDLRLVAA